MDNLSYFASGIPAGQQTDKYSTNPGCLHSKNVDIFSSSKSFKASAWREENGAGEGIVDVDDRGRLELRSNGDIYDNKVGEVILNVATNFWGQYICYDGNYTISETSQNTDPSKFTEKAVLGELKSLIVKYEGEEIKTIVVFTDRTRYTWSDAPFDVLLGESKLSNSTYLGVYEYGSTWDSDRNYTNKRMKMVASKKYASTNLTTDKREYYVWFNVDGMSVADLTKTSLKFTKARYPDTLHGRNEDITLKRIEINYNYYAYDSQNDDFTDAKVRSSGRKTIVIPVTDELHGPDYATQIVEGVNLYESFAENDAGRIENIKIVFDMDPVNEYNSNCEAPDAGTWTTDTSKSYYQFVGTFGVEIVKYHDYYTLLPLQDRKIVNLGEFIACITDNNVVLNDFSLQYVPETILEEYSGGTRRKQTTKTRYNLVAEQVYNVDEDYDIAAIMVYGEHIYLICNKDGDGYIFPCDYAGNKGAASIYYGKTFKGATVINNMLYIVGDDRGVSYLWAFNSAELVPLIGGNRTDTSIIDTDEQYNFDGLMCLYRDNLILGSGNRVFAYGPTLGGKGGSFVKEVDGVITNIKTIGEELRVDYLNSNNERKTLIYQDAVSNKKYESEFEIVYPISLGTHLLEKEGTDLTCSYILPSKNCSLEFWGEANHYTYWTFKISEELDTTADYSIDGTTGDYVLKFIEKNGDEYTFRLEGDLPIQTDTNNQITNNETGQSYIYTSFHHFRRIGEITTDKYIESESRFTNINNLLDLPRTHSLQIMVRGKGTENHTAEVFNVNLVSTQRNRG